MVPVGSGATVLSNIPGVPYVVDPDLFVRQSAKSSAPIKKVRDWPGFGTGDEITLPHEGIVSEVRLTLEGNIAGADAGVQDPEWVHGLMKRIRVSGTGQSDIHEASGYFWHALRFAKNPALNRNTEFFSAAPDENGDFRVTWVIPLATDPVSIAAALFNQSMDQDITVEYDTELAANLGLTGGAMTGIGGTGTAKITMQVTTFPVTKHPTEPGKLVVPDLRRIHSILSRTTKLNGTGEHDVPIFRAPATAMRFFIYVDLGSATGVRNPVNFAAATPNVEWIRLKFGGRQTPYEFAGWRLAEINAEHYGAPLPRGWVCLDLVKENGPRDVVNLMGVTDPRFEIDIRDAATVAANARVELVQEMLYANALFTI